ncbi:MAG: thioredoxin family protein [Chloroflexi bacterium]|nr:thioredoxin family protein [Chloroflexota bacterium]
MRIQIVGAGCPACRNLEEDVRAWLVQQQVEAQVERVDDLVEIMKLGLLALPGLIIDDKLVLTGYPPGRKLDKTLREACGMGVSWNNRY